MFRALRKLFGGSSSGRAVPRRHQIVVCPDCKVAEGQLHELFCLKERCPFCGGQLATCECLGRVLQLTPEEQQCVDEYVDDSIPPLSNIMTRWRSALEHKGRVPFQAQADTPYHAAYRGDLETVRDFLADGFDVSAANEVGYTVLMAAARGGNLEILRLLLDRGAMVRQADHYGYTVLHWMVGQSVIDTAAQAEGVKLLIAAGADVNVGNGDGITPLMNAAWFGCTDAVRELLAHGAQTNATESKGRTARSMALERGHEEIAALLGRT